LTTEVTEETKGTETVNKSRSNILEILRRTRNLEKIEWLCETETDANLVPRGGL